MGVGVAGSVQLARTSSLASATVYDLYLLHKTSWFYMYLFHVFNYTGNAGIDKRSFGKIEVC